MGKTPTSSASSHINMKVIFPDTFTTDQVVVLRALKETKRAVGILDLNDSLKWDLDRLTLTGLELLVSGRVTLSDDGLKDMDPCEDMEEDIPNPAMSPLKRFMLLDNRPLRLTPDSERVLEILADALDAWKPSEVANFWEFYYSRPYVLPTRKGGVPSTPRRGDLLPGIQTSRVKYRGIRRHELEALRDGFPFLIHLDKDASGKGSILGFKDAGGGVPLDMMEIVARLHAFGYIRFDEQGWNNPDRGRTSSQDNPGYLKSGNAKAASTTRDGERTSPGYMGGLHPEDRQIQPPNDRSRGWVLRTDVYKDMTDQTPLALTDRGRLHMDFWKRREEINKTPVYKEILNYLVAEGGEVEPLLLKYHMSRDLKMPARVREKVLQEMLGMDLLYRFEYEGCESSILITGKGFVMVQ